MHSPTTVEHVLALRHEGLGARRIARAVGLPVGTVRDWLAGRVPKHSRPVDPAAVLERTCDACGHPAHNFLALPEAYVYLLGLYLGDGCISVAQRGVYRLRIALDTRYPGIIRSAAAAMAEIRRGPTHVQAQVGNWVEVSAYWKGWPCVFPQHGRGPKHARPITLTDWQLKLVDRWPHQLLRGLIHSDGCRFINTGRGKWVCPRYSFTQASDDIQAIFCHGCALMGLHWTRAGQRKIYVSRKADVARLDEFVGPKR
jgi:hypothetical protein